MYANNAINRRRPEGWAERRRYFRRLTETHRPQTAPQRVPEAPAPARRG